MGKSDIKCKVLVESLKCFSLRMGKQIFGVLAIVALIPQGAASAGTVLVTGATGHTGSLVYKGLLKAGVKNVRALTRTVEKAREVLGCTACDASDGIFVG